MSRNVTENNVILKMQNGYAEQKCILKAINSPLEFFVNGKKIIDSNPDPACTLLTYLRQKLYLCGTKLGCGEGGCGACTVMISKVVNRKQKKVKHIAVNACLTPLCSVHGQAVTTIEGIGSTRTKLHPVQERIAKAHGSQCGFCTPGIVMSMYALLRNLPQPTMKDMEIAFQGNLCRCTGYRPIIEGYKTFTKEYQECAMGENCCKKTGNSCAPDNEDDQLFQPNEFTPYDASQEPIFPPELMISDKLDRESVIFEGNDVVWHRPNSLDNLLEIKKNHPNAKIVVGNTEVGVEVKFKHLHYPVLVLPAQIPELNRIEVTDSGVVFGAAVTLMDIDETLRNLIDSRPEHETRIYKSIVDMLHWFAGRQIRNVASVGGNIMTGSPISDLIPIFTAAEIEMEVTSQSSGTRHIRMGHGFFTGYRRNIIKPDEVLVSIKVPKTVENQYFIAYKQAKRRDDDIAIVNMALNVTFKPNTDFIESINVAYGGMASTVVLVPTTASKLVGRKWDNNLVEVANEHLIQEIPLDPSAPGGMILYRRSLTLSLFFKAYLEISQRLESCIEGRITIPDVERSGSSTFHTLTPNSSQVFERVPDSQSPGDPVGRPLVHMSAYKQATGEAVYCDDMPSFENELYLALVFSTKAHANIISIDASAALEQPGVHAFFSAKDLSEKNNVYGVILSDEEIFASKKVICQGQVVGAIAAINQTIAQKASRMVNIEYEELPAIVTIEDAIKYNSFFSGYPKIQSYGDVDKAIKESDVLVEGEFRIGGQEHFYLETHATIAIPRDPDELEIICSSQYPTDVQRLSAHMTGLPAAKVVVKVKRLGGGFGGKETRCNVSALPVVLAAYRLRKPVRMMFDRDEDMNCSGGRHPFYFKYKVCVKSNGKITGIVAQMYNNAGCTTDYSEEVILRAFHHCTNAYNIPNVKCELFVCRTNLPSNTAFRGFGSPQSMMFAEDIVRNVARILGREYIDVVQANLFTEGDLTFFGQKLLNCTVERCWSECIQQSDYQRRLVEVTHFNGQNRWKKRGIALVPTVYGVGFPPRYINQGGALVHIYTDGSVLVSHGGVEMGQGLYTKMIQVASRVLDIPPEKIFTNETGTDKVPNTISTAASVGSDLNGMAVLNACTVLNERLDSYKKEYPNESWEDWIKRAYFDRISLSATGFYATPDTGYELGPNRDMSKLYNYYVYGASCSEVEIDCLTGDHKVIRTDIVMDLGSSLNPAIDIGQIEGGYMQGYGLLTLEEMIYSSNGHTYSRGPGVYKIPGFGDIPATFNVSLLKGTSNPRAVYSSKAVGEPPLFLASSVFFAIKDAISAARRDANFDVKFDLMAPATSCRIRMGCQDQFTSQFELPEANTFVPWNVMP